MKDTPQYTQHTFILYSAATGKTAQALADGVEPGHIRQSCEVNSQTPMAVKGSGFDKSGLKITPVLSDDNLNCSFDIKITECDFFISDSFTMTFFTEGDGDAGLEPDELSIKFKVICYGCDRPYLRNNFVEYNCAKDPLVSRRHVVPISVNGLASLHIHELNIENSGLEVRDNDTDEGENIVYYNWSPGDTGAFGIAVEGVTYEGNHGVGTVDSYPFPAGRGADVLIVANYPDYYAAGYTCASIPAGTVTMPEYAIYGGVMGQYGGVFEAVPDDKGRPAYWLHQYQENPSGNTIYHVDHQIYLSEKEWLLQSRSYLDDAVPSEWETLATAPMATLTIPATDDGKAVTYEGVYSLPPFSGWSKDLTVVGDGKYFTKEQRFLNTVMVSNPDDSFDEFPVYVGIGGVMYRTEKQTYEVAENGETRTAELTLFPDANGWHISSGGSVFSSVQPMETTQVAVTYAPPRKEDSTFTTEAKMTQEISGAVIETFVPMSLNNDLGGMLITAGEVTAGTWARYPYHRLVDSELEIIANLTLSNATDGDYIKEDITESIIWGEAPQGYPPYFYSLLVEEGTSSTNIRSTSTRDQGATVNITVPLDGVVMGDEAVRSFAGLEKNPAVDVTYTGANSSNIEKNGYGRRWRNFDWVNRDTTKQVTLGNGDKVTVPVTSGFEELVESQIVDSVYSLTTTTIAHEETAAEGKKNGNGYADCYLHIGQTDVDSGNRMITEAASYGGNISAEVPVLVKDIHTVEVDGEVTEDNTVTENTTVNVGVNTARAEAYPRLALPNMAGSDRTPDDESSASGNYSINIKASKTTAYTGGNWERKLKSTYICNGKYRVYWEDEDDAPNEGTEEFFPVECYAVTGTAFKTENSVYKSYGGSAALTVKDGIATCNCTAYPNIDFSNSVTWTLTETAEKYPDGTPSIDEVYPVNKSTQRTTSSTTTQKLVGARTLKVEHIGNGKFRITRTYAPDGYYTYTYDSTKSSEENAATEKFEWQDYNGKIYGRDSEEEPQTVTVIEENVSLSVSAVRGMFEDFVSQFPQRGEQIEPPPDDWQYGNSYADYTDSPIYALSGDGCSVFYEESSSEPKPGKCTVSFVIKKC